MPRWTQGPPPEDKQPQARLLRVKPGHPIAGIITSRQLLGTYVHFFRGRTTPCTDDACPACRANQLPRWYGWFSIWQPTTHGHAIAEITTACTTAIGAYTQTHGQIRGAHITLDRATNKPNARLNATLKPSPFTTDIIPHELDVATILEKIWETHHTEKPETQFNPEAHRASVLRVLNNGHG